MTRVAPDGSVEFRFYRSRVRHVRLLVTPCPYLHGIRRPVIQDGMIDLAMKPQGAGWWSTHLPLAEGDYRFQYVADDVAFTDYAAFGVELYKGEWVSLLHVAPRQTTEVAPLHLPTIESVPVRRAA